MTIIGLVSAGLGVSILPASFKRVQLNEMRWVPIAEEDAVSEMWLVWPKHHEQSPAARLSYSSAECSQVRKFQRKSPKNVLLITCLSKNLTTRIEVLHHSLQIISERENIGSMRWLLKISLGTLIK